MRENLQKIVSLHYGNSVVDIGNYKERVGVTFNFQISFV